MKNEYVTYKNKNYRVSRVVDYPDKGLLTVRKQRMALFLINQGLSLEVISEKLAVSRELLYIWYTEYLKTENIPVAIPDAMQEPKLFLLRLITRIIVIKLKSICIGIPRVGVM